MSGHDDGKPVDLLSLARAALSPKPVDGAEAESVPEGGLFTADFFCEERWTARNAPRLAFVEGYHGRFFASIPRSEKGTATRPCPCCGAPCPQVPGAPRVLNASYPDGHKRAGLEDQLKSADLEVAACDLAWDSPERHEIETEVFERTKVKE